MFLFCVEQKQQICYVLMSVVCYLMESGCGFGSFSLCEVMCVVGIVLVGFYWYFSDMDQFGLVLVVEVDEIFCVILCVVCCNEFELGGLIDVLVCIFFDVVGVNCLQFFFFVCE